MSNPTAFVQMEDPGDDQWTKFQVTRQSYLDNKLFHEEVFNFWAIRVPDGIDIIYFWNRAGSISNVNSITYKYVNMSYWYREPGTLRHIEEGTIHDKMVRRRFNM